MGVPRGTVSVVLMLISVQTLTVPTGLWSGPHLHLTVRSDGATAEFECATGVLDEPLRLDRNHRFDVNGWYAPEHGGPVRRDESARGQRVRYRGQLNGRTLTVDIVSSDDVSHGRYTLEQGRTTRLVRCR
jgi:hypothetical protein